MLKSDPFAEYVFVTNEGSYSVAERLSIMEKLAKVGLPVAVLERALLLRGKDGNPQLSDRALRAAAVMGHPDAQHMYALTEDLKSPKKHPGTSGASGGSASAQEWAIYAARRGSDSAALFLETFGSTDVAFMDSTFVPFAWSYNPMEVLHKGEKKPCEGFCCGAWRADLAVAQGDEAVHNADKGSCVIA